MGGAALLRALNCQAELYHLNEGHSALLTLCLLEWQLDGRKPFELDESDVEPGAAPLRVHDAHARPRRPRQVSDRDRHAGPRRGTGRAARRGALHRRRNAQHDAPRAPPRAFRQRRRDEAPRSVAGHVSELPDRRDHERRPRRHVDVAAVSGAVRPTHSRVAHRQPVPALRGRHSAPRDSRRARRSEEGR